ncbi:MAG: TonB-dependent receptor, partial [Acidobacteria bacterium]|nr:TonB-dependent receptor [Acidobacteriota bacterium]
ETDPRVFGKLSWQASPKSTVQAWLEWAHTKVTGSNGDAFTPLAATTGEDDPEVIWNLSWKRVVSDSTILNVAWAGFSGKHDFNPASGFSIPGRFNVKTEISSGNAERFELLDRVRNQVNVSLSHHASEFIKGDHDFKIGAEIERSTLHNRSGFPGNAFFQDNSGPEIDPSTGMSDAFTQVQTGGAFEAHARNDRISLYAQDSWTITPRVTLNPGVRLDVNRGTVAGSTVFSTSPVAPRLGVAWDLAGDGRTILKAHYGRYYEALYMDFYEDMDPGAFSPLTTEKIFDTSGFVEPVSMIPGQKFAMDPGLRQPYLDQFIAGFEKAVGHGIVLSGTLVRRENKDLIETVSRDGQFVKIRGQVPGTGQRVTMYDYLNPGTDVLIYTNPPELHRSYRAMILTATRRMRGNWQLAASYVLSSARGNTDNLGAMGTDSKGTGANSPDFYGHFLDTPNSLVNANGRLTHDQKYQAKLQATRVFPSLHLSVSAGYTYHSGDTWTPRTDCLLTDDGNGVIGDGILGCHSFPQGTVLYFAEPRGSRRLPARNELDLHVEWTRDAKGDAGLRVYGDVFNANNQGRATEAETFVGPDLGKPGTLSFPRSLRLGLGYAW